MYPYTHITSVYVYLGYTLKRMCTTRLVPIVEQELLTIPDHMSSPPVFNKVRIAQSLA